MNKVLLFAHLKEKAGKPEFEMEASGKSVSELRQTLQETFGNLDGVMVAINEEFVTDDMIIQDGDAIALIPPVSGG
ncbi:molybdopterin converting factor subunit 1 [Bacillus niameyensis]|uniref:molybdopterin converting factor subunit 1 n=1 Tax=Bacillus niameyensis TaxID=1522308 RepID=UPI00078315D5|nr:molybdopterin converting factor subunit 1 [Bacillus niameyensis]